MTSSMIVTWFSEILLKTFDLIRTYEKTLRQEVAGGIKELYKAQLECKEILFQMRLAMQSGKRPPKVLQNNLKTYNMS